MERKWDDVKKELDLEMMRKMIAEQHNPGMELQYLNKMGTLGQHMKASDTRPGIVDNIDRGCRIRTRQHGPYDFIKIRNINIIVHHDNIFAEIGTYMTL